MLAYFQVMCGQNGKVLKYLSIRLEIMSDPAVKKVAFILILLNDFLQQKNESFVDWIQQN